MQGLGIKALAKTAHEAVFLWTRFGAAGGMRAGFRVA
jgi:hypothetical protein